MSDIILSDDQQRAYESVTGLLCSPKRKFSVIEGYAGTGKSTLVKKLLADMPAILKMAKLMTGNKAIDKWEVALTATTNKAAEALHQITGREVKTIQSTLCLTVKTCYKTQTTKLIPTQNKSKELPRNKILVIDEASYIDNELLRFIDERTEDCKVIYIGDPAQLSPVGSKNTPVFNAGFTTARLSQIMRQAEGNQIIDLATGFRETVNGKPWPQEFVPDGDAIIHMNRDAWEDEIIKEFSRPDWHHFDSKCLAWTNKTVNFLNKAVRGVVQGEPKLQKGDMAVVNRVLRNDNCNLKTDQTVIVTDIYPGTDKDVEGEWVTLNDEHTAFLPKSLEARKSRELSARKKKDWTTLAYIDQHWIDLRAIFACTINKSQGSTYDKVYIDLDDIAKCNQPNQIARMMYVAVSRARHQVYLTGEL